MFPWKKCSPGYTLKAATQRAEEDTWGLGCSKITKCFISESYGKRIISYLKGNSDDDKHFRHLVSAVDFVCWTFQKQAFEMAVKEDSQNDRTLMKGYRRVAFVEEFWDILKQIHNNDGQVQTGQWKASPPTIPIVAPKVYYNPRTTVEGTIDEEQLDEKDDDITDDEVVKEEKECNSDESSTEDIKQETCNEEANTQEELAEDAEDSSEPLGLKKHIHSHYSLDPCLLKRNIWRYV
eukprot:Em0173g8a